MGDGYNTWGGKNNSWGNRNRKGRSNRGNSRSTNNRNNGPREEPNKLFTVFIAGIFLVAVGHTALGWINDVIDGLGDAKTVTETVDKLTNTSSSSVSSKSSGNKSIEKSIKDNTKTVNNGLDVELSATDVRDFLLKLDETSENKMKLEKIKVIEEFDYEDVNSVAEYEYNVMRKVNDTDKNMIVVISSKITSEDSTSEWEEKSEVLDDIIEKTKNKIDADKHNQYIIRAGANQIPGYITYTVIYLNDK